MDDQLEPAPSAANDEAAKVSDIVLLANNARDAARALDEARSDIEARQKAISDAETEASRKLQAITALLEEAEAQKAEAAAAFQQAREKFGAMTSDTSARHDEVLAALTSSEQTVSAKLAELEQAIAANRATLDQTTLDATQRSQQRLSEIDTAALAATERQQAATFAANASTDLMNQIRQIVAEGGAARTEILGHHSATAEAMASKEKFEKDAATALLNIEAQARAAQMEQTTFDQTSKKFGDEITRLTEAAEAMLFGATNAGLGAVFKEEVKACDRSIAFGTGMFLLGMLALGGSVIPLINYMSHVADGHQITVADVIARGLIVLPASWFCLHFARRIHASIELRQNWVHKYTVAATVEPFRQQAGEHASAAVLATLDQLMKNPASVLRRHQKMSDPPTEAVVDAAKPVTDGVRKLLSGPQNGQ